MQVKDSVNVVMLEGALEMNVEMARVEAAMPCIIQVLNEAHASACAEKVVSDEAVNCSECHIGRNKHQRSTGKS